MKNKHIILPDIEVGDSIVMDEILIIGKTEIFIDVKNVKEPFLPINITIDWGDGKKDVIFGKYNKDYRKDSIISEVTEGKFSSLFGNLYNHVFIPPDSALYKKIELNISVTYQNLDVTNFTQPLLIRSEDFFESVTDINLKNVKIKYGKKDYQFISKKDSFVLELENTIK